MYIIKENLASKYKFLGIEEGEWLCDFCRKKHLQRMFTVQNLDTGDVERFGSTCIIKALNVTADDIKKAKREMLKDVKIRQEREIADFYNTIAKEKQAYIKSGKDVKLPWTYSSEFKELERKRNELDNKHYKELNLYK